MRMSLVLLLTLLSGLATAADTAPLLKKGDKDPNDLYQPKPLDGVIIEAVETYPNPKNSSLGFGIGIYPFNAYYTGILLNVNYLRHLNRVWSWEILNVSYVYSYQNSLTTELADNYQVNPIQIDRLNFLLSSDVLYGLANGKIVMLGDYIRYINIAALGGLGLVNSTQRNQIGLHFGFRFEVLSSPKYTWRIDVRDTLAVPSITNYATFTLGVGYNF